MPWQIAVAKQSYRNCCALTAALVAGCCSGKESWVQVNWEFTGSRLSKWIKVCEFLFPLAATHATEMIATVLTITPCWL